MRIFITFIFAAVLATAQAAAGVDIAWKVVPRRIAADSFGSRVAKLYFAVVVVVGNNSGHDLQVSSIFFRLPGRAGLTTPIPADPYRLVRGTLEREHHVGIRNSGINTVKALSAAFAPAVAVEQAIHLVFPDKTIPQMANLDSIAMRDATLIPNGTQQSLLVFVGRDLLVTPENRKFLKKRRNDFDPLAAMRALGDLVLEGKSIAYTNRITVTTSHSSRQE